MPSNPYDNPANPSDWPEALQGSWEFGYEYALQLAADRDKMALFQIEIDKLRKIPGRWKDA